jgi:fatty acid desaturase
MRRSSAQTKSTERLQVHPSMLTIVGAEDATEAAAAEVLQSIAVGRVSAGLTLPLWAWLDIGASVNSLQFTHISNASEPMSAALLAHGLGIITGTWCQHVLCHNTVELPDGCWHVLAAMADMFPA